MENCTNHEKLHKQVVSEALLYSFNSINLESLWPALHIQFTYSKRNDNNVDARSLIWSPGRKPGPPAAAASNSNTRFAAASINTSCTGVYACIYYA